MHPSKRRLELERDQEALLTTRPDGMVDEISELEASHRGPDTCEKSRFRPPQRPDTGVHRDRLEENRLDRNFSRLQTDDGLAKEARRSQV